MGGAGVWLAGCHSLRQLLLMALACALWGGSVGEALAQPGPPQVVAQRHLMESRGPLDLASARQSSGWAIHEGLLALGFGADPFWIQVSLRSVTPGVPLVIRVRPAFLDEVTLHLPEAGGAYRVLLMGDREAIDRGGPSDVALVAEWTPPPGMVEGEIYLRVSTTSTRTAPARCLGP